MHGESGTKLSVPARRARPGADAAYADALDRLSNQKATSAGDLLQHVPVPPRPPPPANKHAEQHDVFLLHGKPRTKLHVPVPRTQAREECGGARAGMTASAVCAVGLGPEAGAAEGARHRGCAGEALANTGEQRLRQLFDPNPASNQAGFDGWLRLGAGQNDPRRPPRPPNSAPCESGQRRGGAALGVAGEASDQEGEGKGNESARTRSDRMDRRRACGGAPGEAGRSVGGRGDAKAIHGGGAMQMPAAEVRGDASDAGAYEFGSLTQAPYSQGTIFCVASVSRRQEALEVLRT